MGDRVLEVQFKAQEYTSHGEFIESTYEFSGDTSRGWVIVRNGADHLNLGPGYRLLKSKYCGICATDLARRFLPYPLPQIIGHEVVAADPDTDETFVVEINDTCLARGDLPEIFCRTGLSTHCPGRMVLGIDRLPGGFGRYILAPVNAVVPIGSMPPAAATLAEPFAAALHAVTTSIPSEGGCVAVLGAGRLGLLLVAALALYRKKEGGNFRITAMARHDRNGELAGMLGADEVIDMRSADIGRLGRAFDVVYDCSGSTGGFEKALELAVREVHLKSTNGAEFHGVRHLTEMVVDELSLLPFTPQNLDFHWHGEERKNEWLYIAEGTGFALTGGRRKRYRGGAQSAHAYLHSVRFTSRLPRFDLGIVSRAEDMDRCIRPDPDREISLIRPRGAILFSGEAGGHPLFTFLKSGKQVRSSRCGDVRIAVQTLSGSGETLRVLERHMVTHVFPESELSRAFEAARSPDAIKVLVRHE
jgi:threonine dehydrogenase-like Zn-dependent dehydrogenase